MCRRGLAGVLAWLLAVSAFPGEASAQTSSPQLRVLASEGAARPVLFMVRGDVSLTRPLQTEYERLCEAPCSLELPAGEYRLGVAGEEGGIIRGPVALSHHGVTTLSVGVENRRPARVGLGVVGLVLMGASAPVAILPRNDGPHGGGLETTPHALFLVGLPGLGLTLTGAFLRPRPEVERVEPVAGEVPPPPARSLSPRP